MSYSITIATPPCKHCGSVVAHSFDVTYNYGPAEFELLGEGGLEQFNGLPGAEVAPTIGLTYNELLRERDHYSRLIRGGGAWGTPETFAALLMDIEKACRVPGAIFWTGP